MKIPGTPLVPGPGTASRKDVHARKPLEGRPADLEQAIGRVCAEMESIFIQCLMKEMRNTVPKAGFLGGSWAEDLYTSMADAEVSKTLSSAGGIGLADVLKRQLSRSLPGETDPGEAQ